MRKVYFLLNLASVVFVLFVNYYSQTKGINGQTVGSLSNEYDNLFTPASFAFSIWGLIFLGLILLVVLQGITLFQKQTSTDVFDRMGYTFALVNLGNASWVVVWLYELTFTSVLVMVGMLIGLMALLSKLSGEAKSLSVMQKLFVKCPIDIYAGWITVATIANIAAYLAKIGWDGGFISEINWTVVLIIVAVMLNAYVTWKKSVASYSFVGIWALFAIYSRHQSSYEVIAIAALVGVAVLAISTGAHLVRKRRIAT